MKTIFILIQSLMLFLFAGCSTNSGDSLNYTQEKQNNIIVSEGKTLEKRFNVPDGYKRTIEDDNSLSQFLRNYKLKENGSPVFLYDGREKGNQDAHIAVFELPIENEDLQQCADSVMRVFAEYYWQTQQYDKIAFHFTNGFLCEYKKWMEGHRVIINGNEVSLKKTSDYDDSYENFKKYLRIVFSYAGTYSMEKYESEIIEVSEMSAGDVILAGGSPGHVVMVVDVCENDDGKKAFLLAQGYMPAQKFHVIKNPLYDDDPWYYEEEMSFPLKTAEYVFDDYSMVRRLKYGGA